MLPGRWGYSVSASKARHLPESINKSMVTNVTGNVRGMIAEKNHILTKSVIMAPEDILFLVDV